MIKSKKINIIVALALVFALTVSIALIVIGKWQAENGGFATEPEYATKIFGTDIISIEIIADEDDWKKMLDNAINEQYIMANVIVNGKRFNNVGIRPKGNSSLTQVASSESDRYSFRLQFDEYVKGQTCFGLESFVINNMLGDNTYMKEYISYDLMRQAGVDTPYFGFADVKLNGETWGLYLAVELYNESYERRVYGDTKGMLYNVKSMDMGGNGDVPAMPDIDNIQQFQRRDFIPNSKSQSDTTGNTDTSETFTPPGNGNFMSPGNFNNNFPAPSTSQQKTSDENTNNFSFPSNGFPMPDNLMQNGSEMDLPDQSTQEQNSKEAKNSNEANQSFSQNFSMPDFNDFQGNGGFAEFFGGKGGRGSSGGSLEYTDDNTESYSAIFDNVVGKGTESDYKRVVKAIKALSEGNDLEKYFDVDKILRYLAAHTIVVNLDSYSSSMAQNYYIYERNGKITILPWDYNLAWGGFENRNASSVINFPIDTPVSGVEMSSRPLIEKLFENPEYLERYHSYLQELIDNYFADGKFEEKVKALDALISDYVKNDSTAFCTYDEYKKAVSAFITLGDLRAQSIQGQLEGSVPSTTEEQNANPDKLIFAGNLNLSDLGSMMGNRGGRGMGAMDFMIKSGINQGNTWQNSMQPDNTQQDIIQQNSSHQNNIQQDSSRQNSMKLENNQQNSSQQSSVQEDNTQLNNIQGNNKQENGMPEIDVQQNDIQESNSTKNNVQKNNMQQNSMPQYIMRNDFRPDNIGKFSPDNVGQARGENQNQTIIDNLILIGSLSLLLITAIIFAARYKKRY